MHRIGFLCLLLLIPPAAAAADESKDLKSDNANDAKAAKNLPPAEQFKALQKEFDDKVAEARAAFKEAKTPEERKKVAEKIPKPRDYAARATALAESHPKEPFAVDALLWAVRVGDSQQRQQAIVSLLDRHVESDKIGVVAEFLRFSRSPDTPAKLKRLIENNPHRDIQGRATYALANYLKTQTFRESNLEKINALNREAEGLLEKVVANYADVQRFKKPLGKSAESDLFEIQHLSVGKPVPEIAGEDVDGKEFKLSDYRGKVVLLDFWGNW